MTPLGGTFGEEKQPMSSLPVSTPVGPALTSLAPVQRVVWGPGKAMGSLWASLSLQEDGVSYGDLLQAPQNCV